MAELGDAFEELKSELADAAEEFMSDTCSLIKPTFTDGGASGDTLTQATVASNVPCFYKPAGRNSPLVVGGQAYIASHQFTLPATTEVLAITPEYKLTVQARGSNPQMIFEQPVIVQNSFTALVKVAATLVQQGFRQ